QYSKFFFGVFLIPLFVHSKTRDYAIKAFLIAMSVTVILSYLKYFGVIHIYETYGPAAVFRRHIEASFLMAMSAYLFAHYALMPSENTNARFWRAMLVLMMILSFIDAVYMNMSRTGYCVASMLVLVFGFQHWRWKGLLSGVVLVGLIWLSALHVSPVVQQRVGDTVSNVSQYKPHSSEGVTSVGLRISFARDSLKILGNHPIFGAGTGGFIEQFKKVDPKFPVGSVHNPHNEYLNIGVQFGLVGVGILLWMFIYLFRCSAILDVNSRRIVQATLLAILLGSFANSWLMDTTEGHFFVFIMVLAFASWSKEKFVR
ncbi:MAG TPA: O-antigen ligase family protein, partial [Paenisporosarcina sp.]|nr:O-antigen ligase family protein [Paenisporosarcina sp.]